MLHSFSVEKNLDYHDLKPMICSIFPLTFEEGLLVHADEVEDKELVCADQGLSLYAGVRSELLYYFGQEMIDELDSLAATDERSKSSSDFEPGLIECIGICIVSSPS